MTQYTIDKLNRSRDVAHNYAICLRHDCDWERRPVRRALEHQHRTDDDCMEVFAAPLFAIFSKSFDDATPAYPSAGASSAVPVGSCAGSGCARRRRFSMRAERIFRRTYFYSGRPVGSVFILLDAGRSRKILFDAEIVFQPQVTKSALRILMRPIPELT